MEKVAVIAAVYCQVFIFFKKSNREIGYYNYFASHNSNEKPYSLKLVLTFKKVFFLWKLLFYVGEIFNNAKRRRLTTRKIKKKQGLTIAVQIAQNVPTISNFFHEVSVFFSGW